MHGEKHFRDSFHCVQDTGLAIMLRYLLCRCMARYKICIQRPWTTFIYAKHMKYCAQLSLCLQCRQVSLLSMSMGGWHVKLGTHHAIFVGTTIVVRRDDDRRMTRSHHATAVGYTTRRPTTVEADNAPGRYSTFC